MIPNASACRICSFEFSSVKWLKIAVRYLFDSPVLPFPCALLFSDSEGLEFTTKAFVGRMDAAVSLSEKPRQLTPGMEDAWRDAKSRWPPAERDSIASTLQDMWERAAGFVKDHPNLAAAGAATATIVVAGHWYFQNVREPLLLFFVAAIMFRNLSCRSPAETRRLERFGRSLSWKIELIPKMFVEVGCE